MTAGLVASGHPDKDAEGVAAAMMDTWQALCGGGLRGDVRLDRVTMEAEKATADNNFAIAYNLRGRRGLPRGTSLEKMLDLYFACCSIEVRAPGPSGATPNQLPQYFYTPSIKTPFPGVG